MPEYNNAAGRILHAFERLFDKNQKPIKLNEFASAVSVHPDWDSVLQAIRDLRAEFEVLVDDISQVKDNAAKHKLYVKNLPDIESSIKSFNLQLPNDQVTVNISNTGLVALRFIAADLPQDDAADIDDLNRIRAIVNELQQEIESTETFSKRVREWLLDLVRVIRDSIDRYANRGGRGMRRQFSILLGELLQNYDLAQDVQTTTPTIWTKISAAMDIMQRITTLAEKCKPAVTFAQKCIPMLQTLGLPAPSDPPPDS